MNAVLGALHWLTAGAALLVVAYAVVSDAKRLIIPNWTSIAVAFAFLPAAALAGMAPAPIGIHYGTGAALFAAGTVLFVLGLLGGGDVKLLAAVGVWTGIEGLVGFLMLVIVLGGVLAVLVLVLRGLRTRVTALDRIPWLETETGARQAIPYGIAIGLAAILVFFRSPAAPPGWAQAIGL